LIRAAAFLLQLLIKLSAEMKVKEIEEEEFVQENHLDLQKKNVRKQDLPAINQERIYLSQNLKDLNH
jgi:hypothetical protein